VLDAAFKPIPEPQSHLFTHITRPLASDGTALDRQRRNVARVNRSRAFVLYFRMPEFQPAQSACAQGIVALVVFDGTLSIPEAPTLVTS
jgi:hypothetical protein